MSERDKVLAEVKKFRAENPGSSESLTKLIIALIGLTFYGGIMGYKFIDYLRKKLGVIFRSKSVKVEDVKKQYFILLPLFLKLIEDDKKDENEEDEDEDEDEDEETSLEKLQLL
jgi:hypothetical protein